MEKVKTLNKHGRNEKKKKKTSRYLHNIGVVPNSSQNYFKKMEKKNLHKLWKSRFKTFSNAILIEYDTIQKQTKCNEDKASAFKNCFRLLVNRVKCLDTCRMDANWIPHKSSGGNVQPSVESSALHPKKGWIKQIEEDLKIQRLDPQQGTISRHSSKSIETSDRMSSKSCGTHSSILDARSSSPRCQLGIKEEWNVSVDAIFL